MNRLMHRAITSVMPKFTEEIVSGLAGHYVPMSEQWIDRVFRSASKSFPQGVTYVGYERCTPAEEFAETTRDRNNKRIFDLADSSVYMVKYLFRFVDPYTGVVHDLPPRYMYLLYTEPANKFYLSGSQYHFTGVLSDKVISPGDDSVFVKLIRDRITFLRTSHAVFVNNERVSMNVVYSRLYRTTPTARAMAATTNAVTSIAHYLLARFGYSETFKKYTGYVPELAYEFDPEKYPRDKWVICRSMYMGTSLKPPGYLTNSYEPNRMMMAIPKEHWTPMMSSLVIGFFYVVDHFPERFRPDWVESVSTWRILLGHIIFSGVFSELKLQSNIEEHFASLDDYGDAIILDKLKEIGWHVEDFYDLMANIVANFSKLLLENDATIAGMFGKNIDILYYALSDITSRVVKINYRLRKQAQKRPLTLKSVTETFNKLMTPRSIFKLTSSKVVCESVTYSGDHMYPKLTSKITEQEDIPINGHGSAKRVVLGPSKHLHVSMIEAGSVLFLSKSNPSPSTRLNPYAKIDLKTGTLLPDPRFDEIREATRKLLVPTSDRSIETHDDEQEVDRVEED